MNCLSYMLMCVCVCVVDRQSNTKFTYSYLSHKVIISQYNYDFMLELTACNWNYQGRKILCLMDTLEVMRISYLDSPEFQNDRLFKMTVRSTWLLFQKSSYIIFFKFINLSRCLSVITRKRRFDAYLSGRPSVPFSVLCVIIM